MAEEISAIDSYRAQWKPNEAKIAEYKALYEKAKRDGDWVMMPVYFQAWSDANRPPRHLPIKRLDQTRF